MITKAKPKADVDINVDICKSHLKAFVDTTNDVTGALISTSDGFEVAGRVRDPISVKKMAAMTSSLLALAEAICRESATGSCNDLVAEATDGTVLMMDIPNNKRKLLLTVICSSGVTLGSALWAARNTRQAIGRDLDGNQAIAAVG